MATLSTNTGGRPAARVMSQPDVARSPMPQAAPIDPDTAARPNRRGAIRGSPMGGPSTPRRRVRVPAGIAAVGHEGTIAPVVSPTPAGSAPGAPDGIP